MTVISSNRLGVSTSPYLLQHKDNPVHWQPWDKAALDAARELDRPILLSIGYAACHWCHVMAHESFDDEAVAAVMNRHFVNIKVDREERPDIDQIYMAALGAMGEQGGWPLTMALTPDGKPFWGGTYFPKTARYGRPGFIDVLESIAKAYRERRADIEGNAALLTDHLRSHLVGTADPAGVTPELIRDFSAQTAGMYDSRSGGLRGAPKFPNAPFLEALWRAWTRDADAAGRDRFLETVTAISLGGIYDHIGGGIARYSVDGEWLVPHFEKMLYDNAHFIRHCVWAHGETGHDLFRIRIEETISWLERDLLTENGALASSLDADSEGEEGKYYVWSFSEIRNVLSSDIADRFAGAYDMSEHGNWDGKNIANLSALRQDAEKAATRIRELAEARQSLLAARYKRVPPGRDHKVLTDWNGFAIRAIAEAGNHFGSESWLSLAGSIYHAVLSRAESPARLAHVHDGQKASPFGFASDYGAMINAAMSLHVATGDGKYLDDAIRLASLLRKNHFDGESKGGYVLAERETADLPINPWNDQDEANPSASSQIIEGLARLFLATGDKALQVHVNDITMRAAGRILSGRYGQAGFMNAADTAISMKKLVVAGERRRNDPLWRMARTTPDPRRFDVFYRLSEAPTGFQAGGAFLCEGMSCSLPVNDPETMRRMIAAGESG